MKFASRRIQRMATDHYETLGVSRGADPDEIRRAYKKAALKFHPDRNKDDPTAEGKFKESAAAYEVLNDPQKRRNYDQYGTAEAPAFGPTSGGVSYEEIFGGMSRRHRQQQRGPHLMVDVILSLHEVKSGIEKPLQFHRNDHCEKCSGSGSSKGSKRAICRTCNGYGKIEQTTQFGNMIGRSITTCPACSGRGSRITNPCFRCRGSGLRKRQRTLVVNIPKGIMDGQAVRVRDEGEAGEDGAPRGDLLCYIHISPHRFFERAGNDLILQRPISFTEAALGASVEVPTLDGTASLNIPAGTHHGQLFRLKGQGLPDIQTGRIGNEMVQVLIDVPDRMSQEQRELLGRYAEGEKGTLPNLKEFDEKLVAYKRG